MPQVPTSDWSAQQYTKFEAERNQPIFDLLARVPTASVRRAADLGCGPGNSTELLAQHFPEAAVTGLDSSPAMVAAARQRLPGVPFAVADLATWPDPGPYDLLLANAALQWVPRHNTLLPDLLRKLAPGGTLAVQMPDNFDEPAHQLMRETAVTGPWATRLAGAEQRLARHAPAWYYEHLRPQVTTLDVWRTTYYHPLAGGAAAVVEWFKSTGLRPFLAPLSEAEQADFLAHYQAALAGAYPTLPDGTVLLPFPRLFFVAVR